MTYSDETDRPDELCYKPGELCYNLSSSNYLTQMVNFPTWISDCDSYCFDLLYVFLLTLDLYLPSDPNCTVGFPPLGYSDHIVWVFIYFPLNPKRDALFYCTCYGNSFAYWLSLGSLESISVNFVLLWLLINFLSVFRLELMYI